MSPFMSYLKGGPFVLVISRSESVVDGCDEWMPLREECDC
jgi:hypothetical protein